jgi:hypothetical protein
VYSQLRRGYMTFKYYKDVNRHGFVGFEHRFGHILSLFFISTRITIVSGFIPSASNINSSLVARKISSTRTLRELIFPLAFDSQ